MKLKIYLCLLSFSFLYFSGYAQTSTEICKKYIETIGGEAKLSNLKNVVINQQFLINNQEFNQKVILINDFAVYTETKSPVFKSIVAVKDTSGWQINPYLTGNDKPTLLKRNEVNIYKLQSDLAGPFFNSSAKNIKIVLVGNSEVNGISTFNMLVTYKTNYSVNVFISKKDYLIVKLKDKTKEVTYSDFKKVNGILFPFTTEIRIGAQSMFFNVSNIQTNQNIDLTIFKFPS